MEDRYSIENLIKTFQRHADICQNQRDKWTPEQRENMNANTSLHDIDFDINLALKSMCLELYDLKNLVYKQNNIFTRHDDVDPPVWDKLPPAKELNTSNYRYCRFCGETQPINRG